jgi:hypothetical protein
MWQHLFLYGRAGLKPEINDRTSQFVREIKLGKVRRENSVFF